MASGKLMTIASRRTLSKLLEAAGTSLAEFEALRMGQPLQAAEAAGTLAEAGQRWRPAPLAPLPVFWTGEGGLWADTGQRIELMAIEHDKVVDLLPRPPSLSADLGAYAATIISDSMRPRFRPGRRIAVSPSSTVSVGDDVLVLLVGGQGALMAELQRRPTDGIGLRQFNPNVEFDVQAANISAVHKVVGELI